MPRSQPQTTVREHCSNKMPVVNILHSSGGWLHCFTWYCQAAQWNDSRTRERGMWLYLLVWSVCVCWKHTANQHCVYAVKLNNEMCHLYGELHMICSVIVHPLSLLNELVELYSILNHLQDTVQRLRSNQLHDADGQVHYSKGIWHQDDNRWHQ